MKTDISLGNNTYESFLKLLTLYSKNDKIDTLLYKETYILAYLYFIKERGVNETRCQQLIN